MKAVFLILGIPALVFFTLSITLDLGSLVGIYPEYDLTPYLTARSLAKDLDLAFDHGDSDRYFREQLQRPSHFAVVQKKILSATGDYESRATFYAPDFYVFALIPFVALLGFHGMLLFHSLLILVVLLLGYRYYSSELGGTESALNSVLYFTLIPLPILFLIPSHSLFLFAAILSAVFFGMREMPIPSAAFLGLSCSLQPWSLLFAALIPTFWKKDSGSQTGKFAVALLASLGVFLGIEYLMYPAKIVSGVKWVSSPLSIPVKDAWNTLPSADSYLFSKPNLQQVMDFLFGRSYGFVVYAFPAAALMMAAIWRAGQPHVRRILLFMALFLMAVAFVHPSVWGVRLLASDLWILPAALAFFLMPVTRPRHAFTIIVVLSCLLIGPLLANPMGALINRMYYLQSFPYRFFPAELTTLETTGITANTAFRLPFSQGALYLLNDNFYPEKDFLWVKGESSLEFLIQIKSLEEAPRLLFENGTQENHIRVLLGKRQEELHLGAEEVSYLDLPDFRGEFREFDGRFYLHGKIQTSSGYVPKLLSRDNSDYRYLGCQVHIINQQSARNKIP